MTCVYPHDIAFNAPILGDRKPGSQTPGVPATWASTSGWTEAEKCCIAAAKQPSQDRQEANES